MDSKSASKVILTSYSQLKTEYTSTDYILDVLKKFPTVLGKPINLKKNKKNVGHFVVKSVIFYEHNFKRRYCAKISFHSITIDVE